MSSKLVPRLALLLAVAGVLPACGNINDGHPAVPFTSRVSISTLGAQADKECGEAAISGDGKFVVFSSAATTLGQAGPVNIRQIFRRNLVTGVTEMVSIDPTSAAGDDESAHPVISFNGQFVAFESFATNLLGGAEFVPHVYVRDMNAPIATAMRLVSEDGSGNPGDAPSFNPSISANGRYIAFASFATTFGDVHGSGVAKIYRRDMNPVPVVPPIPDVIPISVTTVGGDPTTPDPLADGSIAPSISADGSVVAYQSDCIDILPGDTNAKIDVFVATVGAGGAITTVLASPKFGGGAANGDSELPALSGDGLFVAFQSSANNLLPPGGDTNGAPDVFLFSVSGGGVQLMSVNSQGLQAEIDADSRRPTVSADGRFVAFESVASNLVPGDTNVTRDIFIRDIVLGTTVRVSVDTSGNQAGIFKPSVGPSLSADGRAIAFSTLASFVKDDSNGLQDVYVRAPLR